MAAVGAVVPALFHVTTGPMSNYFPSESQSHGSSSSTNADNALIDDDQGPAAAVPTVLDFTDYLMFDHVDDFTQPPPPPPPPPPPSSGSTSDPAGVVSRVDVPPLVNVDRIQSSHDHVPGGERMGENARVAFRMKSEKEVVEDGFKWRKYGKKSVKHNSNPRNYFRCTIEGCSVKKIVERDREDPSYVVTTYEGIHNHPSADVVYYATQDSASGRFYVAGCHLPPTSG